MQSGFGWGKGRRVITTTSLAGEASVSIDTPRVRRALEFIEAACGPLTDWQKRHLRNVYSSLPPRVVDFTELHRRALIDATEMAIAARRQFLKVRMLKADLPEAR